MSVFLFVCCRKQPICPTLFRQTGCGLLPVAAVGGRFYVGGRKVRHVNVGGRKIRNLIQIYGAGATPLERLIGTLRPNVAMNFRFRLFFV